MHYLCSGHTFSVFDLIRVSFITGTASTLMELRREFEERCHLTGRQLRIEKIVYTGKEGKTTQGCPVAKWVIRRADPEEKILVVVKKRPGHR